MTWKPIINGSEKREIINIIDEIAEILILNKDETEIIGLFSGKTGVALFLYYYSRYSLNKDSLYEAKKLIESVYDAINSGFNRSAFGGGISGIVWCIKHLETVGFINKNEINSFSSINDFFVKALSYHCEKENFDFIYGSTGIVNYLLERNSIGSDAYSKYIEALESFGEAEKGSIKWKSVIDKDKQDYGYNLSLSHGIAAIIVVLSKIQQSNYRIKKTKKILTQSINFILSKKQNTNNYISNFPNLISKKIKYGNSRLAWCYGDLGIGIALYIASISLNDQILEKESLQILRHSTNRVSLLENSVIDAGICHGTAGIAQIYSRMYSYTNEQVFRNSAKYWINQTLKMARFKDGLYANLVLGERIDECEIRKVMKECKIEHLIFNTSMETKIYEKGVNVSGGEK